MIICFYQSGVLTLTMTNPVWVVKTRLILQSSANTSTRQYSGLHFTRERKYYYRRPIRDISEICRKPFQDSWETGMLNRRPILN